MFIERTKMNYQRAKSGYKKELWEKADFPIVCETCLGENPFVRMVKIFLFFFDS